MNKKNDKDKVIDVNSLTEIQSSKDLNSFLHTIIEKMSEDAAPIYALSAMNHILSLPAIYDFLTEENKELARDIWLRLKGSGMQLRNPPLLFESV